MNTTFFSMGEEMPKYKQILSKPIKYRELTEKYMRPGLDTHNRLYYPMAERPAFAFLRYNPIHFIFLFLNFWGKRRKLFRWSRRSRYYLHMYGFKRRGTKNTDHRVRFNQRRHNGNAGTRNTLAKLLMQYTNMALIYSFIIPWKWAFALAFGMGYFGRGTRRKRERRIKQRLLFAPRAMIYGTQFSIGNYFRLWRIPRRFFQKVYWKRRWKHPLRIIRRRWKLVGFWLICMHKIYSYTSTRNPTGHGAKTRRGVPGNVRRYLRDYTHPFQVTDFHRPHAFLQIYPNIMQGYQQRRMMYGQGALVTMTEWKGHNIMNNYGQFF